MRDVDGLRYKVERAMLHRFDSLFDSSEGRHQENRYRRVRLFLDFQNLEARESRQPQIRDDELIGLLADLVSPDVAVGGFIDFIAGFLDGRRQHLSQAVLVFNEENSHLKIIISVG